MRTFVPRTALFRRVSQCAPRCTTESSADGCTRLRAEGDGREAQDNVKGYPRDALRLPMIGKYTEKFSVARATRMGARAYRGVWPFLRSAG